METGMRRGNRDAERKTVAILKVLSESSEPLSSSTIARKLTSRGLHVSDRTVRYHLRITDKHGFTRLLRWRGRMITAEGLAELRSALIAEQVGFAGERIQMLAFETTFDPLRRTGRVAINASLFPAERFGQALEAMCSAFGAGFCTSELVAVASEGGKLGAVMVPEGKVGIATVCSATINGVLLKAGIPMDSKFGGVLETRNFEPRGFVAAIDYCGSSLDPEEAYIAAGMTAVGDAATRGNGEILASFQEIPAVARPPAENILRKLAQAGIHGVFRMGEASQPVCHLRAGLGKIGMVLLSGMNPIAAAQEAGIAAENFSRSGTIDFGLLTSFWEL
jgi:repressor of nif and glnA expression